MKRYQKLSEEEKDKKHQYACEQYRNLFEEEKKNEKSIQPWTIQRSSRGWKAKVSGEYKKLI